MWKLAKEVRPRREQLRKACKETSQKTQEHAARGAASKSGVRGAILTASGVSGTSSQPATGVHGERKPKSSVLSDGGVHWESALKASMADDILSAHNEMPEH